MAAGLPLTTTGQVSVDQTAYNLAMAYAFRPETYFDACASVRPDAQSFPGKSVIFTITSDLAISSTALDESTDIATASMSDSQITVTLAEYGNAVRTTAFLRGTSFIVPYDAVVANVIGFNAGASLDTVARDVLSAGTNVSYISSSRAARNQIIPADTMSSTAIRKENAALRRNNVPGFGGGYVGYIHPDVSYDLRSESGSNAGWRDPHVYSAPENIWMGEIGMYEGVRWIEAPRAKIFADAGSSTTLTDVYRTLILGQQGLAKAYSYTDGNGAVPRVVPGPVTDVLRRFVPLGWYWLGGYAIYRQVAVRAIESASSIGNTAAGSNDPSINAN